MTVLTNDYYIPGVKALKKSLMKVNSRFNLVILVPKEKEDYLKSILIKQKILDANCILCVHENIIIEYPQDYPFKNHHWTNTFFKLCVADCTQFKKIILLDSDMLIKNNIDHLFEKPSYSAVIAGKSAHPEYENLNSGLMIIEPNKVLFDELVKNINTTIIKRSSEGNNVGDQDVFQETYKAWKNQHELHLDEKYNCFFEDVRSLKKYKSCNFSDISVIHFIGGSKPWSNGCFNIKNIKQCISFVLHGKIFELMTYIEYLFLAK